MLAEIKKEKSIELKFSANDTLKRNTEKKFKKALKNRCRN